MTHFTADRDPNETLRDWADTFPVFPAAPLSLPPMTSPRVGFELVAPVTPSVFQTVETLYNALVEDRLADFAPGTFEHRLHGFAHVLRLYFGRHYPTRLVLHLDIQVAPHDAATVHAFASWFCDFAASLNTRDVSVVGTYKG